MTYEKLEDLKQDAWNYIKLDREIKTREEELETLRNNPPVSYQDSYVDWRIFALHRDALEAHKSAVCELDRELKDVRYRQEQASFSLRAELPRNVWFKVGRFGICYHCEELGLGQGTFEIRYGPWENVNGHHKETQHENGQA